MKNARASSFATEAIVQKLNTLFGLLLGLGLALLVVLGLLLAGRYTALGQELREIRYIQVQGDTEHNDALSLRRYALPQLVDQFFTLNLQQARTAFEGLPWVRHAVVKRNFPSGLSVVLEEHQPVAQWGEDSNNGNTRLLNSFGEVFEAPTPDEDSLQNLPRLSAPKDTDALQTWQNHLALQPLFALLNLQLESLWLSKNGQWRATLLPAQNDTEDTNPRWVELGRGPQEALLQRVRGFVATVGQVQAVQGGGSFLSADLRYPQGYALRWQSDGVGKVQESPLANTGTGTGTGTGTDTNTAY